MTISQISIPMGAGAVRGEGLKQLMGQPHLNALSLLLREAAQNSWDARRTTASNGSVRFAIRSRELTGRETETFRKIFDQSEAKEPIQQNHLGRLLAEQTPIRVLEISDFGTVGLSGGTRHDLPTNGERSRFIDFFFDYGRAHAGSGDGGTYGFGRSSLYLASRAHTILVDSLVENDSALERRIMACRIGDAFEIQHGDDRGRYSGLHFWGRREGTIAQPQRGETAVELSDALNLPSRMSADDLGSTIMIPWPIEEVVDGDQITKMILHHLWPKLVPVADTPAMSFSVEIDDRQFPIPDPAQHDEYRLAVIALKKARTQKLGYCELIKGGQPKTVTGHLAIETTRAGRQSQPSSERVTGEPESRVDDLSAINAVALMRPTELVVKYLAVSGMESLEGSWSGVFICDKADVVRTAFARSEPPAHDDWVVSDRLSRNEASIVKNTLQQIAQRVRDLLGTAVPERPIAGEESSLAPASARFADRFFSGDGHGAAWTPPEGRPGSRERQNQLRVSNPEPVGLEMRSGKRVAHYRVSINAQPGKLIRVTPVAEIAADGRLDEPPAGLSLPQIIACEPHGWLGEHCDVTMRSGIEELHIYVAFEGDYALSLRCISEVCP